MLISLFCLYFQNKDNILQTVKHENQQALLDTNALLALAEGQGEDGTIYISEENLQALSQQGVIFAYQQESE